MRVRAAAAAAPRWPAANSSRHWRKLRGRWALTSGDAMGENWGVGVACGERAEREHATVPPWQGAEANGQLAVI